MTSHTFTYPQRPLPLGKKDSKHAKYFAILMSVHSLTFAIMIIVGSWKEYIPSDRFSVVSHCSTPIIIITTILMGRELVPLFYWMVLEMFKPLPYPEYVPPKHYSHPNVTRKTKRSKFVYKEPKASIRVFRPQITRVYLPFKSRSLIVQKVKEAVGWVYVIPEPHGTYKIGRSKDPSNRMATFAVKLPFYPEYLCLIHTLDMYTLESELHRKYADKRVAGEFFALDETDLEYLKQLAKDDNS